VGLLPTQNDASRGGNYRATVSAAAGLTQRDVMCRVNNAIVAERQGKCLFYSSR